MNLMIQNMQEFLQSGNSAQRFNLLRMRPTLGVHQNALLQEDEWKRLDDTVLEVARTELVGIADLINAGLTQDLGDMGTLISQYERIGTMEPAEVSMTGVSRGERDRQEYDLISVPVPIIFKDFQLDLRHLLASRRRGEGLDLTQAREATELVTRKLESILFNGYTTTLLAGSGIYGYTTHPDRNTNTAAGFGGGDFGTGGNGYKTFKGMMKALADDGYRGPYVAYVAVPQYYELLALYGSLDSNELMIIKDNLPELREVKPSYDLAAENVVVVSLTNKTVDLGVSEGIQPLQWDEVGGFLMEFRTFCAMVPRVKSDKDLKSGVAHATAA